MKAIRHELLQPFALAPRSGERVSVRGPLTLAAPAPHPPLEAP
jgi:hypothetical protein